MKHCVVLGGTFDPVHNGHIQTAKALADEMGYERITLMPCGQAYHKASHETAASQRWKMLELATQAEEQVTIDDRELRRSGPTYTVQTLMALRAELGPEAHLCWVMGQDAAAHLQKWHKWLQLFELANIIVVARPGEQWPSMQTWPATILKDKAQFKQQPNGAVFCLSLTPMAISSSLVRQKVKNEQSIDDLVPAQVVNWVKEHQLYR